MPPCIVSKERDRILSGDTRASRHRKERAGKRSHVPDVARIVLVQCANWLRVSTMTHPTTTRRHSPELSFDENVESHQFLC